MHIFRRNYLSRCFAIAIDGLDDSGRRGPREVDLIDSQAERFHGLIHPRRVRVLLRSELAM